MGLVHDADAGAQTEPTPLDDPDALATRLVEPDREVRRRAVFELDESDPDAATTALLARVPEETDRIVRDAILTVLAGHDEVVVARSLVMHLHSEDTALRTAVVEALSSMPTGVLPLLPALVLDPDPGVRVLTAMILGRIDHPEAISWLVEMIAEDPRPNVVGTAIEGLMPHVGPDHVGLLKATRRCFPHDPFLRFAVDTALTRLGR